MRFHPPRVRLTPELAWVLLRAFAPAGAAAPAGVNGGAAFRIARRYNLAARIGGRHAAGPLVAEVGDAAAGDLRHLYVAVAERAVVLAGLARQVAATAAAFGEAVVLLKGAALHAAGIVPAGWRAAVDVDVLASRRTAARLHAELQRRGMPPAGVADCEHHLQPLRHPCGRYVEVHGALHGLGGGRGVDADDLAALGRVAPAPGWPGALLPDRELLAAHLLLHAVAVHGARPRDYPLLRLVGDLVDLLPDERAWRGFRERGAPLLAGQLDDDECDAAAALALALGSGRVPVGPEWDVDPGCAAACVAVPGAELLLRHLLAGAVDRDYQDALRVSSFLRRPGEGPAALALLRRAWRVLVLSRQQVDEIYGVQRSAAGYLARRLWRPFDLLARTGAALLARRRLRRRR